VQDLYQVGTEMLQVKSCVRGYHIYKRFRNATVGEELNCLQTARIHTL